MKLSLATLSVESGFAAIHSSPVDTKLLCLARFVRMYAYGATYIILVQFLSSLEISDAKIGLFMTLTLLGDVVISFILTLITDQVGRRRVLMAGAALMILSGAGFTLSGSYTILLLTSVVGVVSPSGNQVGPFRAIEESILSQLTAKDIRQDIFAWYTMVGTAGAAMGTLTSGWIVQALQSKARWSEISSFRAIFLLYAVVGTLKLATTFFLSSATELDQTDARYATLDETFELDEEEAHLVGGGENESDDDNAEPGMTRQQKSQSLHKPLPALPVTGANLLSKVRALLPNVSRSSIAILSRLLVLFVIDSWASGMASPSWMSYFFTTYHSLAPSTLGSFFFATNLLSTLSNLAALPLARRLGPLRTMVFTHLPSAVFLMLVPFPQAGPGGTLMAMIFLTLRACSSSMDQAPRQAFLAAAVLPNERTAVLGVVNIAKTLAQAGGLGSAGLLAKRQWWVALFSGAGVMKAGYDLMMLWLFLGLKDREGGTM